MHTEARYLCELSRAFCHEDTVGPPPQDLDWQRLEELMLQHGVFSTFAPILTSPDIPQELAKKLAWTRKTAGRRNGVMLLELARFLPALEDAGSRPIVLKGAGLAQTVYRSPSHRLFADLDILVARDDVDNACEVLGRFGFCHRHQGHERDYYRDHHFHYILRNPGGLTVEVHWALTLPRSIYKFDVQKLAQNTLDVETESGILHLPDWPDQLLHNVLQCIADGYSDLRRIIDASLIYPLIDDPSDLVRRAVDQNLATGLWILLSLVQEICQVDVSEDLLAKLEPRSTIRYGLLCLDLPEKCVQRYAQNVNGMAQMLHMLCVPNCQIAWSEMCHFLTPATQESPDMDRLPDPDESTWRRYQALFTRARYLLRSTGHLGWRMLRGHG